VFPRENQPIGISKGTTSVLCCPQSHTREVCDVLASPITYICTCRCTNIYSFKTSPPANILDVIDTYLSCLPIPIYIYIYSVNPELFVSRFALCALRTRFLL